MFSGFRGGHFLVQLFGSGYVQVGNDQKKEGNLMEEEKQQSFKLWDGIPGYDFNEEVDVKELNSWFFDGGHSVPRWTPMFSWFWNRYCGYSFQYAAEVLSFPRFKGFTERDRNGASYLAMRIVRDEAEIERRTVRFKKVLADWIEDFPGKWRGYKKELIAMYDKLKALDLDKATNIDLMHHLWDMISMYRRMWEIHTLCLEAAATGYFLLAEIVTDYGLTTESPEFQNMFRGFDNEVFQVDKKLCELGKKAIDMGLGDMFLNNSPEDVLAKLEESDKGKKWLKEFQAILNLHGWRMVRMNDLDEPYWLECPAAAISPIQIFIKKGASYDLDNIRQNLAKEREKAVAALLQKVPEEEKELFLSLIKLGQNFSSYSEEHDFYCELQAHALLRRGILGIGRRLAQAGTIDKPEDVFFLNPDEVEMVMLGPEFHKLQYIANRRRAQWEEWKFAPNEPVYTTRASFEEAVRMDLIPSGDPIIIKVVVGEIPRRREELKADIYGVCGAPGVAEGPARVVVSYDGLKEVKPGEVLVCPGTNPAWTPVFGIVKAVVADRGGTLSHAAIVGREYGLPTIVNTFEGTAKIKTGQRIRVDATNGALYVLDKDK
jgi:phosphohistidine swiveling domain-containing protein